MTKKQSRLKELKKALPLLEKNRAYLKPLYDDCISEIKVLQIEIKYEKNLWKKNIQ